MNDPRIHGTFILPPRSNASSARATSVPPPSPVPDERACEDAAIRVRDEHDAIREIRLRASKQTRVDRAFTPKTERFV